MLRRTWQHRTFGFSSKSENTSQTRQTLPSISSIPCIPMLWPVQERMAQQAAVLRFRPSCIARVAAYRSSFSDSLNSFRCNAMQLTRQQQCASPEDLVPREDSPASCSTQVQTILHCQSRSIFNLIFDSQDSFVSVCSSSELLLT
jgi:hypothetical protein